MALAGLATSWPKARLPPRLPCEAQAPKPRARGRACLKRRRYGYIVVIHLPGLARTFPLLLTCARTCTQTNPRANTHTYTHMHTNAADTNDIWKNMLHSGPELLAFLFPFPGCPSASCHILRRRMPPCQKPVPACAMHAGRAELQSAVQPVIKINP